MSFHVSYSLAKTKPDPSRTTQLTGTLLDAQRTEGVARVGIRDIHVGRFVVDDRLGAAPYALLAVQIVPAGQAVRRLRAGAASRAFFVATPTNDDGFGARAELLEEAGARAAFRAIALGDCKRGERSGEGERARP